MRESKGNGERDECGHTDVRVATCLLNLETTCDTCWFEWGSYDVWMIWMDRVIWSCWFRWGSFNVWMIWMLFEYVIWSCWLDRESSDVLLCRSVRSHQPYRRPKRSTRPRSKRTSDGRYRASSFFSCTLTTASARTSRMVCHRRVTLLNASRWEPFSNTWASASRDTLVKVSTS